VFGDNAWTVRLTPPGNTDRDPLTLSTRRAVRVKLMRRLIAETEVMTRMIHVANRITETRPARDVMTRHGKLVVMMGRAVNEAMVINGVIIMATIIDMVINMATVMRRITNMGMAMKSIVNMVIDMVRIIATVMRKVINMAMMLDRMINMATMIDRMINMATMIDRITNMATAMEIVINMANVVSLTKLLTSLIPGDNVVAKVKVVMMEVVLT
jgi:hypothetical protein